MKIYFVTTNKGKVIHAKKALKPFGFEVKQVEIELVESRSEDPKMIALEKAKQAYYILKKPVIVEDSGFFIHALNGFPMTHIKFSLKTLGVENILKMMKGVKDRRAEWRMTLAFVDGKESFKTFQFIEKGILAKSLRPVKRKMMSDYWRVYIPTMIKNDCALCEMEDEDLEKWQNYFEQDNQFQKFGKWFTKL